MRNYFDVDRTIDEVGIALLKLQMQLETELWLSNQQLVQTAN